MKKYGFKKRTVTKTGFASLLLMVGGFVFLSGCDTSDPFTKKSGKGDTYSQENNLSNAVEMLQKINESDGSTLRDQIVERLNQWILSQKLPDNRQPDPMLKELPKGLQPQDLGTARFSTSDGCELRQAVWMRDLSKWVSGDSDKTVQRGARLFDWIVRNIQLEATPADGYGKIPQYPWESLLFGKGTAVDRAWIFVLAAQQQGMDAVILSVPSKEDPKKLVPWAIGLVEGKELYLFDPALGLPIPAKNGVWYDRKKGVLTVQPATLSEVLEDPSLLEKLDVDETKRYPFTIDQIKEVVAMIPASSASLSARFALVESRMVGDQRVVLTTRPSAFAKELSEVKGLSADRIRLWPRPFDVVVRRAKLGPKEEKALADMIRPFTIGRDSPLWKGRAAHIMGKLTGKRSATYYYSSKKANLPESTLVDYEDQLTSDPTLRKVTIINTMKAYYQAKENARYWLGLLNYSLGEREYSDPSKSLKKFGSAVDYLNQTVEGISHHHFTIPITLEPRWLPGAYYNLGRCHERMRKDRETIKADYSNFKIQNAPNAYGNELRFLWIKPNLLSE